RVEEIVEVEEVCKRVRKDQQAGLAFLGIDRCQRLQLAAKIVEHAILVGRIADAESDAILQERRARERAQVEPDNGAFDPESRARDDGGVFGVRHDGSAPPKTRAISGSARMRQSPSARSSRRRPPCPQRCRRVTWLPTAANMRRTW